MNPSTNDSKRRVATRRPQAEASAGNPDRYSVALDAAFDILETLDTTPGSDRPVRLAKVIGIVLDAIYEANSTNSSAG